MILRRNNTTPLLIICLLLGYLADAKPVSICQDPGYASLRPCAGSCVGCQATNEQILIQMGCGSPWPNECYCRTDLFNLATSYLHSCVSRYCTVGGWERDYTSAESFYTSYCRGAGFTADPNAGGNAPAAATADPTDPTITKTTFVTQTVASSSGTSNNGGKWLLSASLLAAVAAAFSTRDNWQVGHPGYMLLRSCIYNDCWLTSACVL